MQFTDLNSYETDDKIVCVHGEPKSQPCFRCEEEAEEDQEDLVEVGKERLASVSG